jgi:Zn-dependent protease
MLLRVLAELLRDPDAGLRFFPALPDIVVLSVVSLLVGLTVHETSHALVADRLGDPTPRRAGRISLNPLRHLDRTGTLLLLVIGIGWGRPVPIDPFKLRFGPLRGPALVALAGPLSNVLLASILSVPIRVGWVKWHSPDFYPVPFASVDPGWVAADIIGYLIFFNLMLAAFNLVPIAPLDGSRLLGFILPRRALPWLQRYELVGPLFLAPVVLMLLALDLVSGGARLAGLIAPLANVLAGIIVGRPLLRSL